jgi:hypothetical protein
MKIDLYFWPIKIQAWILSWGLLSAIKSCGALNKCGNTASWANPSLIPSLLDTNADVIFIVGPEHFVGQIDTTKIKHNKAKIACWVYESITDPYGFNAFRKAIPGHFLDNSKEFNNTLTLIGDDHIKFFDCMDAIFCADEVDYERFKLLGFNSFWLPFGADTDVFNSGFTTHAISSPSSKPSMIKKAIVRYNSRYGIRSGRKILERMDLYKSLPSQDTKPRFGKISAPSTPLYNRGCFVGTITDIRSILLKRMGIDISLYQTPRRGEFSDPTNAAIHTAELVKYYGSHLISFNINSIFAGLTTRSLEVMSCGRLLFQNSCPPDRPMSQNMLKNCIKYDLFTNDGVSKVREQYRHYCSKPMDAIAMGRAARAEILNGHTLKHRVTTIIEKLSGINKEMANGIRQA